jgi:hypothetical protein
MAISGAVLIVVGAILPIAARTQLEDAYLLFNQNANTLRTKVDETNTLISQIHDRVETWGAATRSTTEPTPGGLEVAKDLLSRGDELTTKVSDANQKFALLKSEQEKVDVMKTDYTMQSILGMCLTLAGLCLTLGGWHKLYIHLQKPRDELLKLQIEKAKVETAAAAIPAKDD